MSPSRSRNFYMYIATTRFSKEERASLEIGDTVYPYDEGVETLLPDILGVVLVKTSLPPNFLSRLFSGCYLSTVEYVTYVLDCVSCYRAPQELVAEYVISKSLSNLCFDKVRVPRAGSVGREFVDRVRAKLVKYVRDYCPQSLSLEVFGYMLCFGPVIHSKTRKTS